jgi:hypothetical protein
MSVLIPTASHAAAASNRPAALKHDARARDHICIDHGPVFDE